MIAVLFTGGTISMKVDPATGAAVPAFGASEIIEQVPQIAGVAAIETEDFSRLPGPHVTPDHMWRLATRTAEWLGRRDIDGVVITHGTDTIEETAYLLDLVLISDKPVVLLGAMRTISDASWDGPANLLAAVRVAACPEARGHGVMVVMDELILPAREVRKVHTEASGSFATPEFGPLGVVDAGTVSFRRQPLRPRTWMDPTAPPGMRVSHIDARVELVQCYTGMSDRLIRCAIEGDTKGLAVIAFGRGNVPPSIMGALADTVAQGMLVTISSRCVAGRVKPRYGYEGGGLQLQNIGAILSGDLSGAKARLLQMVALGGSDSPTRAREIIEATI